MPTTNSAQYDKINVKKLPATVFEAQGHTVPIPFRHVTGAGVPVIVEAAADTVFLCVLPANFEIYDMLIASPDGGFGAATLTIGDAGNAARFFASAVLTTGRGQLVPTAIRYRVPADTPVFLTWGTGAPTAARTLVGFFAGVPGA